MRVLIQRVSQASVIVSNEEVGSIQKGFLLLVGVEPSDSKDDIDYLVRKTSNLRIFEDKDEKMNLSLSDVKGEILSISQFTLHANTKKGNRPSFTGAAKPPFAEEIYEAFNDSLKKEGFKVETGEFGADMKVSLTNDGPVTILIDSKNK